VRPVRPEPSDLDLFLHIFRQIRLITGSPLTRATWLGGLELESDLEGGLELESDLEGGLEFESDLELESYLEMELDERKATERSTKSQLTPLTGSEPLHEHGFRLHSLCVIFYTFARCTCAV